MTANLFRLAVILFLSQRKAFPPNRQYLFVKIAAVL